MQLKLPSPNASIERTQARAGAAQVPLAAVRERLLVWAAETGRGIVPGFCEGEGAIEVEAGELSGDLVQAGVDGGPSS